MDAPEKAIGCGARCGAQPVGGQITRDEPVDTRSAFGAEWLEGPVTTLVRGGPREEGHGGQHHEREEVHDRSGFGNKVPELKSSKW